jgi:hypothetical protein
MSCRMTPDLLQRFFFARSTSFPGFAGPVMTLRVA